MDKASKLRDFLNICTHRCTQLLAEKGKVISISPVLITIGALIYTVNYAGFQKIMSLHDSIKSTLF